MERSKIRVIGLTGGIATGKSSVARFLEMKGAVVIDADELSRRAVAPGSPCLDRIVAVFGAVLLPDGTLDRARVREQVFADSEKRRQLEQIIHPEIRRMADEAISAAEAGGERVVFYMAPLLIEAGRVDLVDEIWVVSVSPEVQLQRLMGRDGITRDEALRTIASQMPLKEKETYGRIVIDNNGTPEETRHVLEQIWAKEIGERE